MGKRSNHTAAKAPVKQVARRQTLLDEAALQINRRGAGGVNLNDLAEAVGLSRNALYYYMTDRADITFHCYLKACETAADDLAFAFETGQTASDRIAIYINQTLGSDRPPVAVLSDIDFLPETQRATIAGLQRENVDCLAAMIQAGIEEGSLRPVNVEVAAQSVFGILNWVRLSPDWLGHRDGAAYRRRMTDTASDVFINGMAASQDWQFSTSLNAAQITTQNFNLFDRAQATELKIEQLLAAASRIFNRKGINGASLDDIGAIVGATKGAVYYYFEDRADLVVRCYERAFEMYEKFMTEADTVEGDGLMRAMTCFHLNCQAQMGSDPPIFLQPGLFALTHGERRKLVIRAQKLWQTTIVNIEAGIQDGSCRNLDAELAAEFPAGAFMWLSKWLPEGSNTLASALSDQMCDLMVHGLTARKQS